MLGLFLVVHELQVLLLEIHQSYLSMYAPSNNIHIPIAGFARNPSLPSIAPSVRRDIIEADASIPIKCTRKPSSRHFNVGSKNNFYVTANKFVDHRVQLFKLH
jgi:hypothetical protein